MIEISWEDYVVLVMNYWKVVNLKTILVRALKWHVANSNAIELGGNGQARDALLFEKKHMGALPY